MQTINLEQKVENVNMNNGFFEKAKSHIRRNAAIYFASATLAVGGIVGCGDKEEDCYPPHDGDYCNKGCADYQYCKCTKPEGAPMEECDCYCMKEPGTVIIEKP